MMTCAPESIVRPARRALLALAVLAMAGGCNTGDLETAGPSDNEAETSKQALGESTNAYSFDGTGSSDIPSFHERLTMHLMNRMRMDPEEFGLEYPDMHPRAGEPIDPEPPALMDPSMVEAGRWQGQHALSNDCLCSQNPMEQPAAKNTCCEMKRKNGKVQCVGPRVDCDHDMATQEQTRWNLLTTGTTAITDEFYLNQQIPAEDAVPALFGDLLAAQMAQNALFFIGPRVGALGVAQVTERKPPEECLPPTDPCQVGTCTNLANGNNTCDKDQNPSCAGVCKGESCDGVCKTENSETGEMEPVSCELPTAPDPEECQPEKYPMGYYVSYLKGDGKAPLPTLSDGIHMKLGYTQTMDGPLQIFGVTPPSDIGFQIHYFEPSGEAQSSKVVVGGQCHDLEVRKRNVVGMAGGNGGNGGGSGDTSSGDAALGGDGGDSGDSGDAMVADDASSDTGGGMSEYYGLRYGSSVDLDPGCHRYVFSFTDGDGFIHTYPDYGSLGVKVEERQAGEGNTITWPAANDENCPIWSPDRPQMSCLPEGDSCVQGETRSCYTGRDNTRGKGICELGTESCENGRWSGVCEGETTPEAEETCGDDTDNDCNGFVDEGCDEGGGDDTGTGDDTGMSAGDTGTEPDTSDAGGSGGDTSSSDGGTTSPDGSSSDPDAGESDAAIDIGTGGGGDAGDESDGSGTRGCGACSQTDSPAGPLTPSVALFLLGLLGLRRRR